MTRPPAYLPEVIRFVEEHLDQPLKVALALAALLTDDDSLDSKVGPGSEFQDYVSRWLLSSPAITALLDAPDLPVSRALVDGKWLPVWKESRRNNEKTSFKYNVSISFAGKDRAIAEGIAQTLTGDPDLKRVVFYDEFEKTDLWGENLFSRLHRIYSVESMFCVILFSHAYLQRAWTRLELRAAQMRTLEDRRAYVLPVAVDSGAIPPEFESVGYWTYQPGDEFVALPAAIEAKINTFIGTHYLSVEEITGSLSKGWIRHAILDAFADALGTGTFDSDALFTVGLLAGWDLEHSASPDIAALLQLVLFSPGRVSDLFESNSLVLQEGYTILRRFNARELFFFSTAWSERVQSYFPEDWNSDGDDEGAP